MAKKLIIEIVGDSRSYQRALGRSSKATTAFGRTVKTSTGTFSGLAKGALAFAGVAVGVRAVGGALTSSVRASTDFQASLQKMIGLSGVAGDQIAGLRQDVLKLAPALGRSPQELAEALFFITSSGIPAAKALDVLTVSAKASAAGLGETQVVADAVTSALNAYGQANITATQATDVLVATVREGKGEATEFAGVIGNVAAIAGELGVSFDQVGAALAAETRLGTDAQTAAIQLQQVFSALLNTSPKVAEAFASVGINLEDVRKQIAQPNGFLPALRTIKDAFGENTTAIRQAFPEIRAFRGILALVGKQSAPVAGIFKRLAQSTGSLETAFGSITQTQAQQFARLNASIEVFRITLGSALAPAILDVVKPLNKWLSVSQNQDKVQRTIRQTVRGVVGAVRDLVATLRPFVTTTIDVVRALGGFKNVLKALIPLFVATKIVGYASAITGLGTTASVAAGRVSALRLALLRLGAIGVVVIGIELFIHRKEIVDKAKEVNRRVNEALGGKLFGGDLPVNIPLKVENLPKLVAARQELAKLNGEDDVRVAVLDRIIKRLREIDALNARKIVEPGEGRLGGPGNTKTKTKVVVPAPKFKPTGAPKVAETDADRKARLAAALQKAQDAFTEVVDALSLKLDKAKLTRSIKDDLKVLNQIEQAVKDRIKVTGRTTDLARQLFDVAQEQRQILADAAKAAQFKALGLTSEGDKPTPGSGSLLKKATGLQKQIKGTVLDTSKTRSQLRRIVNFLRTHLKTAGKDVRQAVLEMLNGISGAFDKDAKTGPLTKTHGLATAQIIKNLGLSAEQADEIQRRLAHATVGGGGGVISRATGSGRTPRTASSTGKDGRIMVESHTTINLDGHQIANVVTRNQQKDKRRNPKQKRGPHRK